MVKINDMNNQDLTILSVSYNNKQHLLLNYELTNHLNSDSQNIDWIVIENSPSRNDSYNIESQKFKVLMGDGQGRTPIWHHTLALKQALKKVKTRFVLVLDPDFYIVMREWVNKIIDYMIKHDLSIIGVPWHPKHLDKYRYFIAVHCCFIDTDKFPIEDIDFTPDYPDGDNDPLWPEGYVEEKKYFYKNPITKILTFFHFFKSRRRFYTDTGSVLYKKYCMSRLRYELFKPVFRVKEFLDNRSWKGKILEYFLPDELCYFPKLKNSYSIRGFRENELLLDAPTDWEEFMWKNKPFGFHVRRNSNKDSRSEIHEIKDLQKYIKEFMNYVEKA